MHCKMNICENVLRTIWAQRDTLKVRLDLKEAGIRPHLHPLLKRTPGSLVLLVALYVLSKDEKKKFLDIIRSLKTPSNYVRQFAKCIASGDDLKGLKSHDYHILMQQLLPLCCPTLLDKDTRVTIMRLSRVFLRLCMKSVDPSSMETLFEDIAETLCMLEKVFPPSFFDVMSHLPVHLVQQLDICNSVHSRWMHPMERHLKKLKGYNRQHAQPEGSMAKAYIIEEPLGFYTKDMQDCEQSLRRIWDDEEEPSAKGKVVERGERYRWLTSELKARIHEFVLTNA